MKQESNLAKAYLKAYETACLRLLACDIGVVCQNSKAVFETDTSTYVIRYFNQECRIKCTDGSVVFENMPAELSITEKVLVLHYLICAKPRPMSGSAISFQEVPNGGSIYHANFKKRAVDPLVNTFSRSLKEFMEAGVLLGGSAESFGDASITVFVFPFFPMT